MQAVADPLSLKFTALLNEFHAIIEGGPTPEKAKHRLDLLKEKAKTTPELNGRQTEAIFARCDNYINGEYGNTKKANNFGHSKTN